MRSVYFVGAGLLVLTLVGSAHADAIDGDWCHADGRRLSIRGPDIVTPGGKQMVGDYNRHGFIYVVPTGEIGAGDKVVMTLLSETLMHSRQGGDDAPVQVWNRCRPTVSARPNVRPAS